ncbi:MAG: alanine racemase [Gammaproteobacteria bacterium]|nr:alanine racemase [Gammaproteobacteria bacterium]
MTRPVRAAIDLKALRANLQCVRAAAPLARVLAVIKANGYGHGLTRVAEALHDADAFGVASVEEALVLREAGIAHPIVMLEGFFEAGELAEISRHRLSVVLHHEHQLQILERTDIARPISVWIKIDTGMHRIGFPPELAASIYQRLRGNNKITARIRLMTHLANADDRSDEYTERQLTTFLSSIDGLDGERSVANSAGVLAWPQTHMEWVRPGIMLFGVSPFLDSVAQQEGLSPVMTLTSRLIATNRFRRGDPIGYGGGWICPEDMTVGVVAIGYGDGYPRSMPAGAPVLVRGQRVSVIGRVSMDMLCIDLRGLPQAQIGDEVELWGRNLPVEEVARLSGTIPYELLCGITQRVPIVEQG